jgi:hypothetical protein
MNEEEKEAITTLKDIKEKRFYTHAFDNGTLVLDDDEIECVETILNLIKKQQKELNKQKNTIKVINEKIEELFEEMEELDSYDEDDNEEKRELTDMIVLLKELKQEIIRKE